MITTIIFKKSAGRVFTKYLYQNTKIEIKKKKVILYFTNFNRNTNTLEYPLSSIKKITFEA